MKNKKIVYVENKDIRVDDILNCFKIGEHNKETNLIYEIIK